MQATSSKIRSKWKHLKCAYYVRQMEGVSKQTVIPVMENKDTEEYAVTRSNWGYSIGHFQALQSIISVCLQTVGHFLKRERIRG